MRCRFFEFQFREIEYDGNGFRNYFVFNIVITSGSRRNEIIYKVGRELRQNPVRSRVSAFREAILIEFPK